MMMIDKVVMIIMFIIPVSWSVYCGLLKAGFSRHQVYW